MQTNPNANRGVIRRRLGYYAVGVAIGFLVLGMIMTTRQRMHQAQADREADAGQTVPTPGTPIGREVPLNESGRESAGESGGQGQSGRPSGPSGGS